MKTKLPLLAILILIAIVLRAQEPKGPPQGGPGQGGPGQKGQKGGPGGQGGGNFGGGAGEGFRPPLHPLEMALDANGDGIIDAKEIANAVAALKKLDKNGDGKLTEDEYRPLRPTGGFGGAGGKGFGGPGGKGQSGFGGGPAGRDDQKNADVPTPKASNDSDFVTRLFQNDKNKDGKITKDELPESMRSMFERMDTNQDGAIDRKEAEAFSERLKSRTSAPGQSNDGKRPPLEK